MKESLYKILDRPWAYRLATALFAPGAARVITGHLNKLLTQLPPAELLLDVGCGPASQLFRTGLFPIGADLSLNYAVEYMREGATAVVASAEALPFPSHSFDGVWSFFLFHHLPDPTASAAIHEFLRVSRSPGYLVVVDWVSPRFKWRRPLAAGIQYLDRGNFIRDQTEMESLLPDRADWSVQRLTYSATGLEMLICRLVKR